MEGPPLGPGGEDITWPDQVAPRGRKASSTRKMKPQTSNFNRLCSLLTPVKTRSVSGTAHVLRTITKRTFSAALFPTASKIFLVARMGTEVYPMSFLLRFMVSNPICFLVLCRVPL